MTVEQPTTHATPKEQLITASSLKERGWTDSMIRRFAPTPDKTASNPHYRCAAPMRLFALSRIAGIEASTEFREAAALSARRRKNATKATATKRNNTLAWVASQPPPELPAKDREALTAEAIEHFNRRAGFASASVRSQEYFLQRITVNYIRHRLTGYEHDLRAVAGRVGIADAVSLIREKVYSAIAATYPWLAEECQDQMRCRVARSSAL